MTRSNILFFFFMIFSVSALAQSDTLPNFSVTNAGRNRFIIGWTNNYDLVKQISIQRSHDSLKNYTTILSVTDPNARQNGFADTKAPTDHMYYRLFVVLDKGQFYFTAAKQPDTSRMVKTLPIDKLRDTATQVVTKPIIPKKPDFIPSFYVFTNKDGYVFINLPDAVQQKYHIKFYEDDDSFLFEIRNIKEPALTLDKTNFIHAGWFRFELYNDEKLVEKNKFYLAKEF